MSEQSVHIVPTGKKWAVRLGGRARAHRVCGSLREAFREVMALRNRPAVLFAHDSGGRISKRIFLPVRRNWL